MITSSGAKNARGSPVAKAAPAIRVLADYLERNPNTLLSGKGWDHR
jgi:hypothetical protein